MLRFGLRSILFLLLLVWIEYQLRNQTIKIKIYIIILQLTASRQSLMVYIQS